MPDILKSNVQTDAYSAIVDNINSVATDYGPAPIGSERGLSYCNTAMLEYYSFDPSEAWLASYLSGSITRSGLVARVGILGGWYARTTWAIHGLTGTTSSGAWDGFTVPFSELDIFFVKPEYHQSHYDATIAAIAAADTSELFNDITRTAVVSYLVRIKNVVLNNATTGDVVDLRVCHSSCHSNCHGSRGRR
jgi:hypothetical protein